MDPLPPRLSAKAEVAGQRPSRDQSASEQCGTCFRLYSLGRGYWGPLPLYFYTAQMCFALSRPLPQRGPWLRPRRAQRRVRLPLSSCGLAAAERRHFVASLPRPCRRPRCCSSSACCFAAGVACCQDQQQAGKTRATTVRASHRRHRRIHTGRRWQRRERRRRHLGRCRAWPPRFGRRQRRSPAARERPAQSRRTNDRRRRSG